MNEDVIFSIKLTPKVSLF